MTKKLFINELKERDKVHDLFLVSKKETGVSRNGKPYLNLRLMDKTGEIEAKVWDNADKLSRKFKKSDLVMVKGFAVPYQEKIQLNILDIVGVSAKDIHITDFLPASKMDPDKMFEEIESMIEELKDRHLKKLLLSLFSNDELRCLFKTAPAAKSIHHNYIGGLLEHVLSLCKLTKKIAAHYDGINTDLIVTGAILHDIGKIYELSYERDFDYTDEGRLLGHITIGISMIDEQIKGIPNFPDKLAMLLKHMLLSHHGHLEFGSPKRPKTIEAVILYYCDDLDSKVQSMQAHIEKDASSDSDWTHYHRLYNRYIHKGYHKIGEASAKEKSPVRPEEAIGADHSEKEEFDLFKI